MIESAVFKMLASNDTGSAPGHQGGIVIPKDIEDFFPDVIGVTSTSNPTVDVPITAELVVDGKLVANIQTRYQFQTWGGTRSPERRLTGNLGPLRNAARSGDIVLFSRDADYPQKMLLALIRSGATEHQKILQFSRGRRWGIVEGLEKPIGNSEIRTQENLISELGTKEFKLLVSDRTIVTGYSQRKVRNVAFRKRLLATYGPNCQATNVHLVNENGLLNIDAAHIVPVEFGGGDDVRNGLLLSKDMHWAFDKGLFGISDDLKIIVPSSAAASNESHWMSKMNGQALFFDGAHLRPHIDAIRWHRNNRLLK